MTQKTQVLNNSSLLKVPESRFESFLNEFHKLEKKFKKYGATVSFISDNPCTHTGIQYRTTIVEGEAFTETQNYSFYGRFVRISFDFPEIKANGFKYLFTLDGSTYDDTGMNRIHTAIDYELTDEDFNIYSGLDDFSCDHCNTNRHRTMVHLFKKGRKTYMIGRQCAKPYFGESTYKLLSNLKKVYDFAEKFIIESDYNPEKSSNGFRSGANGDGEDIKNFVKERFFLINKYGFLSKSRAEDNLHFNGESDEPTCYRNVDVDGDVNGICEKHNFDFDTLYKFVEGKLMSDKTNFQLYNNTMIELNYDYGFKTGLVTYAVFMYMMDNDFIKTWKNTITNEWVDADINSKVTINVKVKTIRNMGSYSYNGADSFLITMEDEDGRQLKAFYSGSSDKVWKVIDNSHDNDVFCKMTGTVKKKDEYKGIKQTQFNRVKFS